MTVNWNNPYAFGKGHWLKGNLHAHSSPASPCSIINFEDLLSLYQDKDYHFLSISDHMEVTEAQCDDLVLLPGLEWNSRVGYMPNKAVTHQHHLGLYAMEHAHLHPYLDYREQGPLLAAMDRDDSLRVANHPNWMEGGHYRLEDLLRLNGLVDGMEIYNAVIEQEEGEADATALWDRLLAADCRLLGFASDDSHAAGDIGHAWIMVRSQNNSPAAIYSSIKQGNFYCSTGVLFQDLGRTGDSIFLELEEEACITLIGKAGRLLHKKIGTSLEWDFAQFDTPYVRIHVVDKKWRQAWSQPFFKV